VAGDQPETERAGSLLTAELRAMVGSRASYTAAEPVSRSAIRYFARATGIDEADEPPVVDEGGAAVAPPTMVCETNEFYAGTLPGLGYLGHVWDLPLPPSRGVRGGNEYVFVRPLREGDVVTVHWHLAEVDEHRTRSGGVLLSVVSDIEYVDADGDVIARNRETMLYQPKAAADAG
jgi:hypothetical protein